MLSTSSSGSTTANGSSPTMSRAHHTAWPSPSGACWRVKLMAPASGWSRARMSCSAFLPRAASVVSSSNMRSKWSSITPLLRPVTNTKCSMPASLASSTTYWISGLSTMVSISFGIALVAGRTRVPRPATGKTALRIFMGCREGLEGAGYRSRNAHVGSRFAAGNKGGCMGDEKAAGTIGLC